MTAASDRLAGIHPALIVIVNKILAIMAAAGHPMRVTQGLRTEAQQVALYAQGRTKPGPIVTECDGIKKRSNHQAQSDGYGHAVDLCFDDKEPFAEKHPWELYGKTVRAFGLTWGGDWHSPYDRPHMELPKTFKVTT